ncbi:MAG TPA: diguanylate cyclase [Burkholderiaceae bacterium]|nr:diguanylate cyclase [Burkholderiaceae bacterium]
MSALRRAGSAPSQEVHFDLRVPFAVERRLLPAQLLVGLLAVASASAQGAPAFVWGWFALFATVSAARYLIAITYGDARRAIPTSERCAHQYLACAVADVLLWAGLLTLVPNPAGFFAGAGAFAPAGAVILAALTFGGWPRVWTFYIAAWVAISAVVAFRTSGTLSSFAFAFPLWLLAIWWLGRQQPLSRQADRRGSTLIGNPTRFGWQAAIHAMPTPVIVARNNRIIEVNRSACEFIGRSERSILGTALQECLIADPPEALQPERHRSESSAAVEMRPADRTFDGASWSGRVRYMEPGRASSIMVIALTRAAQEPFGPARLLDDARRFAEWVGGLKGLPWYRDERGALVLPQEFPAPTAVAAAPDPGAFPLAHLLASDDRERYHAIFRDVLRSGALFDEQMTLRDAQGMLREVRVVCIARPGAGDGAPVVGTIAAARPATPRAAAEPVTDLLSRLPVVVWLVDASGRVVHATGNEPRRWGLVAEARTRPEWQHAFAFKPESVATVRAALEKALAGQASYDVRNARTSRSGGRLNLRSHFVPYIGKQLQAVLVMDTIASPSELLEIDRLKRSKSQYKSLVEASASLIWACDENFTLTFASRRAARDIYGYESRELLGQPVNILLPTDAEQPGVRRAFDALREGRPIRDLEAVHLTQEGRRVIVSISAVPLRHPGGRFAGAIGMNADLTALKSRETRLSEALRVERTVLDSAGQAIAVVKQGLVLRCNDAFLRLAGLPPEQLARTPLTDCLLEREDWIEITGAADEARSRDQAVVRELRVQRGARLGRGEGAAWCQVTARSIAAGEFVLVVADIDTIKRREASALHEAQHDDLTGLPNRRLLAERAAAALATSELRKVSCAIMAIDLDGFKEVNDRYGHEVGDATLREIAARLTRVMRPQDTVARRGGDEFAVLVPDVGSNAEVERIAARLLQAVEQPVPQPGSRPPLNVSASIGIALAPEQGRDLERLLQLADLAMYDAKLKGKNRYAFAQGAGLPSNVTPLVPRASRTS